MILKQGHEYVPMPHDGKVIRRIYRGGRCYYASPYSPEATQALKAAFPQYWTAICDYGFAHPQLVPFVNENPLGWGEIIAYYKIVEYVETTGMQNLKIDAINTTNDFTIIIKVSVTEYGATWTPILVNPYYGGIWIGAKGNQAVVRQYSGSDFIITTPPSNREIVEWKIEKIGNAISLYFGGVLVGESNNVSFVYNRDIQTCISSDGSGTFSKLKIIEIQNNNFHLVPVIRKDDGTIGMFDVVNRIFYTNAGTGTFIAGELTDK